MRSAILSPVLRACHPGPRLQVIFHKKAAFRRSSVPVDTKLSLVTRGASSFETAKTSGSEKKPHWDIRMLYDGECPLCMREVNMLKGRDKGVGKIDFVDISSSDYSSEDNASISYDEAMGEIHAILPNGQVVKNVEVFRRLYEAVGLGWVYAITKIGPIGKAADWVYGIWARYRMQITGRPDLATVLAEKKSCKIR